MFDDRLEEVLGDPGSLADLAGRCETQARRWGCRKLQLAAAWADAHSEVDHPSGGVLVERLVSVGPVGTPPVAEFAAHGLVGPFATTVSSARSWIGDALTVRHRLPRLWERVVAGEVHAWQARQVANLTAHLSIAVVGIVDEQTSRWITQLPWASVSNGVCKEWVSLRKETHCWLSTRRRVKSDAGLRRRVLRV